METKRSETVISRFLVFFSYRLHILYQSIKEELMDQFNVYKDMKARTNGEIHTVEHIDKILEEIRK